MDPYSFFVWLLLDPGILKLVGGTHRCGRVLFQVVLSLYVKKVKFVTFCNKYTQNHIPTTGINRIHYLVYRFI